MKIRERIAAVYVLQRFVRMSRVLLPLYLDLVNKKKLTADEKEKVRGIKSIYENFEANPSASKHLINSDILNMIQSVYNWVISKKSDDPESFHKYNEFIKESDRLIDTWDRQILN